MATKTKTVSKRFPANTTLEELTFLNNKKIDAELYAYLQLRSYPVEGETVVFKRDLGTQKEICEAIKDNQGKTITTKTYRAHLKYLIICGYVIDVLDRYVLPPKESIYCLLPMDTVSFMQKALSVASLKVYIYLGQRWRFKQGYLFTRQEIAEHIGLNAKHRSDVYEYINACLNALYGVGLIDFELVYVRDIPYLRLTKWTTEYIKNGALKNKKV